MRIIDLSMPVLVDHVRWKPEQSASKRVVGSDTIQVTTVKLSCHSFTHVDAQRHYFPGLPTIEATPLDALVGDAAVVDLMDVQPDEAIGPEKLAERSGHVASGDRVILKSGWHRHRSFETEAFWREAPYLTREGAQWILDRGVRTICYDFPQDYVIRHLLDGRMSPVEEHVTHDILLRNGVHMVEYLTNTAEISQPKVFLSAAPLKIPGSDGAPARVYVIEN
ncbi:MAG TPA: cyclase family protein [Hyphomicrobiaceae bacterium]|nr:cyclase family protein [Hyphomicrobiaceae bacterium]